MASHPANECEECEYRGKRTTLGSVVTLLTPTRGAGACAEWRHVLEQWYRAGLPWIEGGGSDVSQARGELASQWLATSRTPYSLWLDDDIEVQWRDLLVFLRSAIALDVPFVCGQYVGKGTKSGLLTARFEDSMVIMGKEGGYRRVIGCGFGCVLVHRGVFEAMAAQMPLVRWDRSGVLGRPYFLGMVVPSRDDPEGPRIQLGEDYAFCQRARALGIELLCDTRLRLWHHGDYPYGWEDADDAVRRVESIEVAEIIGHPMTGSEPNPQPRGRR
jgi:hypothetical protein